MSVCSLEIELASCLLSLVQKALGQLLHPLFALQMSEILPASQHRVPFFVAAVLALKGFEIKEEAFLLCDGGSEVERDACVEAVLKAGLSGGHAIVEVAIKILNLRVV